jgi:hypothetical protein
MNIFHLIDDSHLPTLGGEAPLNLLNDFSGNHGARGTRHDRAQRERYHTTDHQLPYSHSDTPQLKLHHF